jgi:hypothetical protein
VCTHHLQVVIVVEEAATGSTSEVIRDVVIEELLSGVELQLAGTAPVMGFFPVDLEGLCGCDVHRTQATDVVVWGRSKMVLLRDDGLEHLVASQATGVLGGILPVLAQGMVVDEGPVA